MLLDFLAGLRNKIIVAFVFPVITLAFAWLSSRASSKLIEDTLPTIAATKLPVDISSLSKKIDLIIALEKSRDSGFFIPFILAFGFALFVIMLPEFCNYFSLRVSRSFVVMNKYSEESRDRHENLMTRMKWIFIGASITIPGGLVAATIRAYFWK